MNYDHTVKVGPPRQNHAIWSVTDPMATSTAPLNNMPGQPQQGDEAIGWYLMDEVTGAHVRIWKVDGQVFAAWIDGPRTPDSGHYLAWVLVGKPAGGDLVAV
ncbi:hypothetical protein HED60_19200 [Planctomycetales bacterium ZRK34]|nr:hypothetical protein HED60_19200 [Planctomycetales bacterium ZRK34]